MRSRTGSIRQGGAASVRRRLPARLSFSLRAEHDPEPSDLRWVPTRQRLPLTKPCLLLLSKRPVFRRFSCDAPVVRKNEIRPDVERESSHAAILSSLYS